MSQSAGDQEGACRYLASASDAASCPKLCPSPPSPPGPTECNSSKVDVAPDRVAVKAEAVDKCKASEVDLTPNIVAVKAEAVDNCEDFDPDDDTLNQLLPGG
jgi:hypothetical protein